MQAFQARLGDVADLAFVPVSADLQYLAGVPRDLPNFGAVLHPGAWLEGAWLTPTAAPVLALPRMSAEFGGLGGPAGVRVLVVGDHDDPDETVRGLLRSFELPARARVAIGDATRGATVAALQRLLPGATFSSASELLAPMRAIKSEDEIAVMRRAGEVTEAAFAAVLARLEHGMTELDVVSEIDHQLRRHGSLGPSFTTSLYASGPRHPLLFGQRLATWPRRLDPPVSILFDFGAILDPRSGREQFDGFALRHVPHGDRVHAVAQAGRRWPVGEHVAEVPVAAGAADLGAAHAVGAVVDLDHRVGAQGLRERRPATARRELPARREERLAAAGAHVGARLVRADEAPLEGPFGAVLAKDAVRLGRESGAPLVVAQSQSVGHGGLLRRS
jgi:hypothetical protein